MFRFSAEWIRYADDDGRLHSVGVQWTEPDRGVVEFVESCAAFLAIAWAVAIVLIFVAAQLTSDEIMLIVGVLGLATAIVASIAWAFASQYRSLLFHADGRLEYPDGLPRRFRKFWTDATIDAVVGIQIHQVQDRQKPQAEPTFEVHLYMRNGDVLLLSQGHSQWEAHKIVTMLTAAYRDMMDARASLSRRTGYADGIVTEIFVE